jgi:hypothetical protein
MSNATSAPRNDGKSLEGLVALIESKLLPKGFVVEQRRPVYDEESGAQVAELDILIRGQVGTVGTAPYSGLIECRDRPSDGPAPASWIEQLVGRRTRFKLDKVMAVSTTGFAGGAKKYAEWSGIELRALEDLTADEVASWLPQNAPVVFRHFDRVEVEVRLKAKATEGDKKGLLPIGKFDPNTMVLNDRVTGKSERFLDVCLRLANKSLKLDEINSEPREIRLQFTEEDLKTYVYMWEKKPCDISAVEFRANVTMTVPNMPLSLAARYVSQPSILGQEETFVDIGRWTGAEGNIVKEVTVFGYPKKSPSDGDTV